MNAQRLLLCWLLCSPPLWAQELSGYVTGMPSLLVQQPGGHVWGQMLLHNRLNAGWQMAEFLRVDVGMRNRFLTGSEALLEPQSLRQDLGWVRLSWNWVEGRRAVANTTFDRLNLTFEKNQWKLQAGRQRINWGHTFAWNPNNIFNTHAFLDLDYPERPGADALRATYFHDETSSSEVAVAANHHNKLTAALLHRWNWKHMDFQLLAGTLAQDDFVLGGAWTSDLRGLNLRSEFSYFHPFHAKADNRKVVALSLGADYVFASTLRLQAEILYNNIGKTPGGFMGLQAAPLSPKALSFSEWNVLAIAAYPLTPRLEASLSALYWVDMASWYTGLRLDYSLLQNLDFSLWMQFFSASRNDKLGHMQAFFGFLRLQTMF